MILSAPHLSQRAIVLGAIVGFHVLLAYLLATGLGASVIQVITPPLIMQPYEEPTERVDPPPPPPVDFDRVPIEVPPPVTAINEATDDGNRISAVIDTGPPKVDPVPIAPRVEPIHLVGKHSLPNTEDFYPPVARRLGIEGATNVQVCVDERGRMVNKPTVLQSSGDARLDQGALQVAQAGKYARSARGETFVPNCYAFRIIFTMK